MGANTSVSRTLRAIRGVKPSYAPKIAGALLKCAEVALRKSQSLVPVDTGALKGSAKVAITGSGFGARAEAIYDAPYAVYVHEDLEAAHAEPTGAKFLERAVVLTKGTQTSVLKRALGVS